MSKLKLKNHGAFTLIEMVIVLFIISLLLLIIIPNINTQKHSAQSKTDAAFQSTLQTQVDMYDNDDAVSWDQLEKDNYLSASQTKKAKSEGYTIHDGTVVGPKK
ncbi:prepilin-type N-terminal cleavage/methylation domain-containing protein [Bombilactobacillus folatiphilus]|uniref:Prepilin-type N-terminal cleavage/methylation domain-containing protein n=1 Tax=Bombilactobacillus folatiphilus TaxID=2923362 RepID=A0ABY4PA47_9LACO|nr:competence type IV pilus major pilin ComGC [Bombilactobacillus folatiphilus]UQS82495.1 prepilin-type N-terminal cleavage/methylation domain-containing protein [Bombilactobacillus folatiphilus]